MSHIGCHIVEIGSWVGIVSEHRDCSSVVDASDSRADENGLVAVGLVARDFETNLVVVQEKHFLTGYVARDSHPIDAHAVTKTCLE